MSADRLTWNAEMRSIAKEKKKVLVKFQANFKHAELKETTHGDYKICGPFDVKRALAMLSIAVCSRDVLVHLAERVLRKAESRRLDSNDDRRVVAELIVDELLGGGR